MTYENDFLDSIDILKQDEQTVECYVTNWEKTFDYRMHQIETYETLEDVLNVWPIIGKPIGLTLVNCFIK